MRIAALQFNTGVGDLSGNASRIAAGAKDAKARGADLLVTSELALLGYPPHDLLLDGSFVQRSWEVLQQLASDLAALPPVLVGLAEPRSKGSVRPLFNTAALLRNGCIEKCLRKTLTSTCDSFNEGRYFETATAPQVLDIENWRIGVAICGDIAGSNNPGQQTLNGDQCSELATSGAQCIVCLSASPFALGKQKLRESILGDCAARYHLPLIFINQVGGNDELVFEGRSCVFSASGKLIARGRSFAEDLVIVDLQTMEGRIAHDDFAPESEIWQALVLGTRDYVRKSGFNGVLIGLSGGIDSSIVAVIAVEALGSDNVLGVLMPSPYSSKGSVEDALGLAHNLGIRTLTLPIISIMSAFDETLREAFKNYSRDTTEENIQSRIRGSLIMSLSNKYNRLVLTTGNKSEAAVGYCTLYGDTAGALAVIADVPKMMIYRISRWLNEQREIIPDPVLTKAPSAELRPNQTDQDTLPPYDVLDEILRLRLEMHQSVEETVARGFDVATVNRVFRMIKNSEFKRNQVPPGIRVTDWAFGRVRHMPIVHKYEI